MSKRPSATEPRAPLSAGAAFVVHLTTDRADVPNTLQGRVEHVRSGESLRFGSVTDLVSFMQRVLASPLQNHAEETTRTCAPSDDGSFTARRPRSLQIGSKGGAKKEAGKVGRLFLLAMVLSLAAGARPAAAVSCGATGVFYDIGQNPDYGNSEAQCVYSTPGLDTFTVPPYWPQLRLDAYGAGNSRETGLGGWNGTATDLVAVGQVFDIRVGGQPFGSEPILGVAGGKCDVGGFNGGGNSGDRFSACGGAGASDVRPRGGSFSDRLVVGGGGGGSIFPGFLEVGFGVLALGGAGGGASGRDGVAEHGCVSCGDPGGGGNQFGGGPSPGNASSAGFGFGGAGGTAVPGINDGGAGGGGGWYGGGGSGAAFNPGSGGGGSGYPGQGGEIHSIVNNGDGQVIVSLFRLFEPLAVTVTLTSDRTSPVAAGIVVKLTAKVAINSGAEPVGKVVFTDYGGAHPAQIGEVYLDQDGEFTLTRNVSSLPNGAHHEIVATFVDGYAYLTDTSSSALTLDVSAGAQSITFTSTPTTAQAFGPPYTVTATASSGLPVSFSIAVDSASATVCTLTGSLVSFVALGTCNILANQAGNAFFNPAPQLLQSITVGPLTGTAQTIYFTSTPPSNPHPNDTYTVTASGGGSGRPVLFAAQAYSQGVCTVSAAGQVAFSGGGMCTITADQAGGNGFAAAAQVYQDITVTEPYVVTFETTPPSAPHINDTYTVTAHASHGTSSTLTLDATSSGCTLTGVAIGNRGLGGKFSTGTVTFSGYGTCIVNGNQPGNLPYFPAAQQVQQSVTVNAPTATVTATAAATSSVTVTVTKSPQASSTATATATATATPTAAGTEPATPAIAPPLKPQLCYRVNAPQQRFDTHDVNVVDALGAARGVVQRPGWLCRPADLNGADLTASTAPGSFVGYRVRLTAHPRQAARHTVSNTFGIQTVAVYGRGSLLLLPSAQDLSGVPAAPSLSAADHFACYGARAVNPGRHGPEQAVTLQDLFGSYSGAVGRPTRLCLPADINGTSPDAQTHPDALLCYRLKPVRHVNVGRVFTSDDRGAATLVPRFAQELCVPSILE